MVQLNQSNSDNPLMYDLCFMYSLKCDLTCSFCMYNCHPGIDEVLSLDKLSVWLKTVDTSKIASFGVYGGEPSILLHGYAKCMDLVNHLDKPHFVITNGTWSKSLEKTKKFLEFCAKYKMHIVISGTPEHRAHQDRRIIEALAKEHPNAFRLKPKEENYHAMGRLKDKIPFKCTQKCMWWKKAIRIAVLPDGCILLQNCDGIYPIVGNMSEPFRLIDNRIQRLRGNGFDDRCPKYMEI